MNGGDSPWWPFGGSRWLIAKLQWSAEVVNIDSGGVNQQLLRDGEKVGDYGGLWLEFDGVRGGCRCSRWLLDGTEVGTMLSKFLRALITTEVTKKGSW